MTLTAKDFLVQLVDQSVKQGLDWRKVIWELRDYLSEIEQTYARLLFDQMQAKIGPVTEDDKVNAMQRADEALETLQRNSKPT